MSRYFMILEGKVSNKNREIQVVIGNKPLTDKELDELELFLDSELTPKECMSLEGLDGYLTAIVSGPVTIMPSEWLPVVWGDKEGPEYESMEQAKKIMGYIMSHMNSIADALMNHPHKYTQLVREWDDEYFYIEAQEWCYFYLKGMRLRKSSWTPMLSDDEYGALIMPILLLTAKKDDPDFGVALDTKEKRQRLVDELPDVVLDIYEFWQGRRMIPADKMGPLLKPKKIGRNDPCECGSGKKFKKCCGSSGKLN